MQFEFENICIDCKKRGYHVGFTFKTITYKGFELLDMPQQFMDGATLAFFYKGKEHIIHSIEKSVQITGTNKSSGELQYRSDFAFIKCIQSQTKKKFTFFYNVLGLDSIYSEADNIIEPNQLPLKGIYYLMDLYSEKETHLDIVLTIINNTDEMVENFDLYWFMDFDIGGSERRKQNNWDAVDDFSIAMVDKTQTEPESQDIYAGIISIPTDYKINKGAGDPNHLMPTFPNKVPNFVDSKEPNDYAIGMQFSKEKIEPKQVSVIPLSIVVGEGKDNLLQNINEARVILKERYEKHKSPDFADKRFIPDQKYSKINTAINRWCGDGE